MISIQNLTRRQTRLFDIFRFLTGDSQNSSKSRKLIFLFNKSSLFYNRDELTLKDSITDSISKITADLVISSIGLKEDNFTKEIRNRYKNDPGIFFCGWANNINGTIADTYQDSCITLEKLLNVSSKNMIKMKNIDPLKTIGFTGKRFTFDS